MSASLRTTVALNLATFCLERCNTGGNGDCMYISFARLIDFPVYRDTARDGRVWTVVELRDLVACTLTESRIATLRAMVGDALGQSEFAYLQQAPECVRERVRVCGRTSTSGLAIMGDEVALRALCATFRLTVGVIDLCLDAETVEHVQHDTQPYTVTWIVPEEEVLPLPLRRQCALYPPQAAFMYRPFPGHYEYMRWRGRPNAYATMAFGHIPAPLLASAPADVQQRARSAAARPAAPAGDVILRSLDATLVAIDASPRGES